MNGKIDWIRVAEFGFVIIGFAFAMWKAWVALSERVNGYGRRVGELEKSCTAFTTEIGNMKHEQDRARNEREELRTMVASNIAKIEGLRDDIMQERLAVVATLHSIERAAAERDSALRERLSRIEERIDITRIVRTAVREFKDKDGERE